MFIKIAQDDRVDSWPGISWCSLWPAQQSMVASWCSLWRESLSYSAYEVAEKSKTMIIIACMIIDIPNTRS